jgi:hypothetical protein
MENTRCFTIEVVYAKHQSINIVASSRSRVNLELNLSAWALGGWWLGLGGLCK